MQQKRSQASTLSSARQSLHRKTPSLESTGGLPASPTRPYPPDSRAGSGKKAKKGKKAQARTDARLVSFEYVRINQFRCRASYQVCCLLFFSPHTCLMLDETGNANPKCTESTDHKYCCGLPSSAYLCPSSLAVVRLWMTAWPSQSSVVH